MNFQIHCAEYRMCSQRGSTSLPRYWITLDKEIIFDYPKQFAGREELKYYPYETQISDISSLIREYIDCPCAMLPGRRFEADAWGLTDILKAADKRLGRERLQAHFNSPSDIIQKILTARFG